MLFTIVITQLTSNRALGRRIAAFRWTEGPATADLQSAVSPNSREPSILAGLSIHLTCCISRPAENYPLNTARPQGRRRLNDLMLDRRGQRCLRLRKMVSGVDQLTHDTMRNRAFVGRDEDPMFEALRETLKAHNSLGAGMARDTGFVLTHLTDSVPRPLRLPMRHPPAGSLFLWCVTTYYRVP